MISLHDHLQNQIQNLEQVLEKERKRQIIELEGFESLKLIINQRNESLTKLNENYKQLITDMEIKFNEENLKSEQFIKELEKEVGLKSNVISSMKKKIESLIEKEEQRNNDIINQRNESEDHLNILEKEKLKLHQDFILTENRYKKMIKDLEILVFKVNLENFNLKDRLNKKLQNKIDENKFLLEQKTGNMRERLILLKPNIEDSILVNNKEFINNISNSISLDQNSQKNKINIFGKNKNEYYTTNKIYCNNNPLDIDKEIEKIENQHSLVINL